MIFYRKGKKGVDKKGNDVMYDLEKKINNAVFPALQGGPHQHQIGALAVALKQVMTSVGKRYSVSQNRILLRIDSKLFDKLGQITVSDCSSKFFNCEKSAML